MGPASIFSICRLKIGMLLVLCESGRGFFEIVGSNVYFYSYRCRVAIRISKFACLAMPNVSSLAPPPYSTRHNMVLSTLRMW